MIALMLLTALLVYLGIVWLVIKRLPSKKAKWIAVAVFVLIPTWDEILGRIYFKSLCETESGTKIYKTVELPAEYWDANGEPKFITWDGLADKGILGDRYDFSSEFQEKYSQTFRIRRHAEVISDKQTREALGRYIRFIYFGGWIANHFSVHVSGTGCPSLKDYNYRGFLKQVFKTNLVRN